MAGQNDTTSESIEMYLLRIALLQRHTQPVPVPMLAEELSVSPVSANEMCRKLTQRALVTYEPYKGVTLTAQGEKLARRVLRHRRLWEVFMVEKLGIPPAEAEEIACRFEHVTPSQLAERLALFLGNPTTSPQNEPIPAEMPVAATEDASRPLAELLPGEHGQISGLANPADTVTRDFLTHLGARAGAMAEVLARTPDGTLLVALGGQRLTLSPQLAAEIIITPTGA